MERTRTISVGIVVLITILVLFGIYSGKPPANNEKNPPSKECPKCEKCPINEKCEKNDDECPEITDECPECSKCLDCEECTQCIICTICTDCEDCPQCPQCDVNPEDIYDPETTPFPKNAGENGRCPIPSIKLEQDFWKNRPLKGCKSDNPFIMNTKGLFSGTCNKPFVKLKDEWVDFENFIDLSTYQPLQYVEVLCKDEGDKKYFMSTPMSKPDLLIEKDKKKPTVIVLMIDALSQFHFIRSLPKTYKYLSEINENKTSRVFKFNRYTIMGAYSPPNRYAFFSGFVHAHSRCFFEGSPVEQWMEDILIRREKRTEPGEDLWMWEAFDTAGYLTYSARDMCSKLSRYVYRDYVSKMWTTFHFQKLFCDIKDKSFGVGSERCIKNRNAVNYALDSSRLVYDQYHKEHALFMYVDIIEPHEPSMRIARVLDEPLIEYISHIIDSKRPYIMVIASDHGIGNHGQIVKVSIEERLPSLYILTSPGYLSKQQDENLQKNSQKIINPTDIFQTLVDIAEENGGNKIERSWALNILKKIPDRDCIEAGIGKSSCPCLTWKGEKTPYSWKKEPHEKKYFPFFFFF